MLLVFRAPIPGGSKRASPALLVDAEQDYPVQLQEAAD
jgi:hypothetical protein